MHRNYEPHMAKGHVEASTVRASDRAALGSKSRRAGKKLWPEGEGDGEEEEEEGGGDEQEEEEEEEESLQEPDSR